MQADESRKAYSPNSGARALDLSRSKIYELMKDGKIKFVEIDGIRRIPASEIDRLTREGTEPEKAAA